MPSHLTHGARCLHGRNGIHMPITERGTLGPGFEHRLKTALDSVVPSAPLFARYFLTTTSRSSRPWRFASALVGIGAMGVMALSAFAATGSPSPAVWGQRAVSTIQSVSHIPESSPNQPSPTPDARLAAPVSQQTETSQTTTPPTARQTAPSDKPQPTDGPKESPPSDRTPPSDDAPPPDHSEHPSPGPEPTDSPGHNQEQDPQSSPPPHDHGGDPHGH
jgi:hypothetical protein